MNQDVRYRSLAHFSVEDFIAIMDKILISGSKLKGRKLHWYHLIMNDNLVCPATGKRVEICSYDVLENRRGEFSFHFNFYTSDWELFTIDHKIPLGKGGSNFRDNIQPMIAEINWEKGDTLIYTQ